MNRTGKWAIGIVLTAAAAFAALQTVSAPTTEGTQTPPAASEESSEPPAQAQTCAYQWAYEGAPELTSSFDAALKTLNPEAGGRVEFFGEDCIYADGTSTFLPMQTDFYVRLQVDDLTQEEEFGNWVLQVMQYVTQLPREELQGPNYGFVEFRFEKSDTEHIVFRVPIQKYIDEAQGKSGAELFKMFYAPP